HRQRAAPRAGRVPRLGATGAVRRPSFVRLRPHTAALAERRRRRPDRGLLPHGVHQPAGSRRPPRPGWPRRRVPRPGGDRPSGAVERTVMRILALTVATAIAIAL